MDSYQPQKHQILLLQFFPSYSNRPWFFPCQSIVNSRLESVLTPFKNQATSTNSFATNTTTPNGTGQDPEINQGLDGPPSYPENLQSMLIDPCAYQFQRTTFLLSSFRVMIKLEVQQADWSFCSWFHGATFHHLAPITCLFTYPAAAQINS